MAAGPRNLTAEAVACSCGAAAPAQNWLTAAWAGLALVAQRQITAMHNPGSGLPHLLAPAGFVAGASGGATNLFGWVATGLVEEVRSLAAPSLLPASINDSQNDIASPAFGAYRSQDRAAERLDSVLAILAIGASQALFASDRRPHRRWRGWPPASGRSSRRSRPNEQTRDPRPASSPASCTGPR